LLAKIPGFVSGRETHLNKESPMLVVEGLSESCEASCGYRCTSAAIWQTTHTSYPSTLLSKSAGPNYT